MYFLYDDIVHSLQNTIDWCINSATDQRGYVSERRFTKFNEITQCNGHYTVQGHSRSPILVPKYYRYLILYHCLIHRLLLDLLLLVLLLLHVSSYLRVQKRAVWWLVRYIQLIVNVVPVVNPFCRHRLYKSLEQSLVASFYLILAFLLLLLTDRHDKRLQQTQRHVTKTGG